MARASRHRSDLEIEIKAPAPDLKSVARVLRRRGATLVETLEQSDQYFAHPGRDFARTDEALRLRTNRSLRPPARHVTTMLTYKGPKLDRQSKTRRELEIIAEPEVAEILVGLRFSPVATVTKQRRLFHLDHYEVCLDDVVGVGTFVEVEWRGPATTIPAARRSMRAFLMTLGLTGNERRSYLELLLAGDPVAGKSRRVRST